MSALFHSKPPGGSSACIVGGRAEGDDVAHLDILRLTGLVHLDTPHRSAGSMLPDKTVSARQPK